MKDKKSCIFYNEEKDKCTALKNLYCEIDDKPCSFYKLKRTAAGKGEKENVKK